MAGACKCGNETIGFHKCDNDTTGFHKMRRISGVAKELLPSQEGFCCMQLELFIRRLSLFTPTTRNKETYNGELPVVGSSD